MCPGAIFLSALLLALPASAQEEQQTQQQESPAADAAAQSQSNPNPSGTSRDRLFFALPNFLTLEDAGQVPPLTAGGKFKAVAESTFDPVQYVWWGLLAGISQAQNGEKGYGQGAAGYGKRYGSTLADAVLENFMVGAVFPTLLRQDPRYFQLGKGGFLHRVGYAASRIVITRTDSGREQFNYSEILGGAVAGGISAYTYHPRAERNVSNAVGVWLTQLGWDTLTLVTKEFWPDIRRKISHKRPEPTKPPSNFRPNP